MAAAGQAFTPLSQILSKSWEQWPTPIFSSVPNEAQRPQGYTPGLGVDQWYGWSPSAWSFWIPALSESCLPDVQLGPGQGAEHPGA